MYAALFCRIQRETQSNVYGNFSASFPCILQFLNSVNFPSKGEQCSWKFPGPERAHVSYVQAAEPLYRAILYAI